MAFKQIILCDESGQETSVFDPRGDTYFKYIVGTPETGETSLLNNITSNDSPEYEYGEYTLALNGLGFSLGSGATNCNTSDGFDDFSLYPGMHVDPSNQYDYDGNNNRDSGFTSGGTIAMYKYNIPFNRLPYAFSVSTESPMWEIGSGNAVSSGVDHSIFTPQGNITLLESGDDGIESILIKIPNSTWDTIFTPSGISWEKAYIPSSSYNPLTTGGGGFSTDPFEVLDGITGGTRWGNSEYPAFDGGNLVVPYDLLEGKKIHFGVFFNYKKTNAPDEGAIGSTYVKAIFDETAIQDPFGISNMSIKTFSFGGDLIPPPNFGVYVSNPTIDFPQSSVNEGEGLSGNFNFGVTDFQGMVICYVFDSVIDFDSENFEQDDIPEGFLSEEFVETLGFNEIDDVANYGNVFFTDENDDGAVQPQFGNGAIIFNNVSPESDWQQVFLNYLASEVDAGQTENFSVFISLSAFQPTGLPPEQADAWSGFFNGMSFADRTFKIASSAITINDIPVDDDDDDVVDDTPPTDEDYEPGDILITNPSDIIFHLIEQELGYNKGRNVEKITEARINHSYTVNPFDESGEYEMPYTDYWRLAFAVDREIDSKKLLQEISKSTKLIPTFNNDTFSYANIKNTYTGQEETSIIKAEDVIKYNASRTDIDELYTEVEVQYGYDYGIGNHLKATEKIRINTDFYQNAYGVTMDYGRFHYGNDGGYDPADITHKNNYYGLKFDKETNILNHEDTSLIFKSDYIQEESTAIKLAEHLLLFHSNQHNVIEMTLPLKYYNLEVGDLIEFDKMILGRKLYGEKYVLDELNDSGRYEDMPIRCGQYILPLFMVTDITKTLKDVKIKVIQMHHLSKDFLYWKGEQYVQTELPTETPEEEPLLGDMNGDGSLNVLDIVTMVTLVLSGTFSNIGDVNQDGALNVLDVVLLVQIVLGGGLV